MRQFTKKLQSDTVLIRPKLAAVRSSPVRTHLWCKCTEYHSAYRIEIRGGRRHFLRLRLRSCSKIFESWSGLGYSSNLRIRLLFRLRPLPSIQP